MSIKKYILSLFAAIVLTLPIPTNTMETCLKLIKTIKSYEEILNNKNIGSIVIITGITCLGYYLYTKKLAKDLADQAAAIKAQADATAHAQAEAQAAARQAQLEAEENADIEITTWPPKPSFISDAYLYHKIIDINPRLFLKLEGGYWIAYNIYEHALEKKFFKGIHNDAPFKEISPRSAENYKIHLMPKKEDLCKTINLLLNATKNDPELQNLINQIKAIDDFDTYINNPQADASYACIVIYPASGKQNAQRLLDKLYSMFKDQEGLNVTPRWNEKVTSLIYFAQGNADEKKLKEFQKFFEPGDDQGNGRVYFKADATGVIEDYHLINPANMH
jgi:hypothetical protein